MPENSSHCMSRTPEYNIWLKMWSRCTRPEDKSYHRYGALGISVSKEWDTFVAFITDMGKRPSPNHSIDRIDVYGNYCPENCRWATSLQQGRNKRNNVIVEVGGRSMVLSEAIENSGLSRETVKSRMSRGMSAQEALSRPAASKSNSTRGRLIVAHGMGLTAVQWSKLTGIGLKTLLHRIHSGWEPERAVDTPIRRWK